MVWRILGMSMKRAGFFIAGLLGACSGRCGAQRSDTIRVELSVRSSTVATSAPTDAGVAKPARDTSSDACLDAVDDARQRRRQYAKQEVSPELPPDASENPWFQRSKAPDLNGIPEIVWSFGMPVAYHLDLYRGGACALHLGSFEEGGSIEIERKKHDGWSDFVSVDYGLCEGMRCGCTPEHRYYTFSNGQYVEVRSRRESGTLTPCPPAFGSCNTEQDGFTTCAEACAAQGETCVARGLRCRELRRLFPPGYKSYK